MRRYDMYSAIVWPQLSGGQCCTGFYCICVQVYLSSSQAYV